MGFCVDGVCACLTGYEGQHCETEWSAKFTGDWQARETFFRNVSYHNYNVTINKTGNADSFVIYNLADSMHVICRQNKFNSFTFVTDQVIDSERTVESGNGTLDSAGTKVTGFYSIRSKDTTITTSFTWTR
jgi:hypothetical protein